MDLFETIRAHLTADVTGGLAASLGESAGSTAQVFGGAAVPAVLAGLVGTYPGEAGAARLLDLLRSGGHDGGILPNLAGALSGGAQTDALLNVGKGLVPGLFGARADAVVEMLAASSGIRRGSAAALLSLAIPVVLATLGRQVQGGGGDAAAVRAALEGVRGRLGSIAPAGLAAALGAADPGALAAPPDTDAADAARKPAAWPWLIVPAIALALFFSLRSCQDQGTPSPAAQPPPAPAPAPAPQQDAPAADSR